MASEALVDPGTRGDPMCPLRWTTKSTAKLAKELTGQGTPISPRTVARLLKADGYSLQANSKTIEGRHSPASGRCPHPDRDAQFRYIATQVQDFRAAGDPVISVDTKKRELVGNYAKAGQEWEPNGTPRQVKDHDFPGELGKVAPYGIYDLTANTGWVNVGTDRDTAQFAVESIRRWWTAVGRHAYPGATRLLITADAGGSNGARLRLLKTELARLAAETGLDITVLHFPPGTSKWNKIEHRLFSAITMNWRGRPLESHEVVIETIAATTTDTGLSVQAVLDTNTYEKGIRISDKAMRQFESRHVHRHDVHGQWNYTITGTPDEPTTPPNNET